LERARTGNQLHTIGDQMKHDRLVDDYFTRAQAAAALGLSSQRVTQLADAGRLPCVKTALGRLYLKEAVSDYALGRARR
jgi:excisionase family DNA binding protein